MNCAGTHEGTEGGDAGGAEGHQRSHKDLRLQDAGNRECRPGKQGEGQLLEPVNKTRTVRALISEA